MIEIPKKIRDITGLREFALDRVGMSGSNVLLFEDMVLKIQPDNEEAENEYCMMQWLGGKLPVPEALCREKKDGKAYLLMSKMRGQMSCEERYMQNPDALVHILGEALRMLWCIDISGCPCSNCLDRKLQMAEYNVRNNLVDLENVEPETFGEKGFRDPAHLLDWLKNHRPPEEIVFSHGDFCLPNVFVEHNKISGFIDLGRAGTADRWQDIALAYRSLLHNYSGKYSDTAKQYEGFRAEKLFEELGISPDEEKIRYYILMDELF